MAIATNGEPLFSAVSPSATQLAYLLRCLSFAPRAQVKISADGLRFSSEDGSVMEVFDTYLVKAFVFLSKELFSTYTYQDRPDPETSSLSPEQDQDTPPASVVFAISLTALIETLQILSFNDGNGSSLSTRPSASYSRPNDSLTAHRLARHGGAAGQNAVFGSSSSGGVSSLLARGTSGLCRLSYDSHGSPLSLHLTDAGVRTTCDLTSYTVTDTAKTDIPFDRDNLCLKIITRAAVLADAIQELAGTSPVVMRLVATPHGPGPFLSLSGLDGPLSSASVEFSNDAEVLETFACPRRVQARYSFALVKAAYRAALSATKVSIRVDGQGVLSLQFLIDVESVTGGDASVGMTSGTGRTGAGGAGGSGGTGGRERVAFVDFRIVPLVDDEHGSDDGEDDSDVESLDGNE